MPAEAYAWLNGKMVPEREAAVSLADRGVLFGDGLFETLRAYNGNVFRLLRHLARLEAGAAALSIPLPCPTEALAEAVAETLHANRLGNASVRLTLTRGPGPGIQLPLSPEPTLFITARALTVDRAGQPCTAHVVSFPRNERSPLVRLKTLNYLECVLGREEARRAGADEGLFRNRRGSLTEGAASNLFLVREGVLFTADEDSGLLPGITREAILELASTLGIPRRVSPVAMTVLGTATEAFLTNTLIEVAPLVAVDGRPVGSGEPGPVTRRLAEAYRDLVRSETASQ